MLGTRLRDRAPDVPRAVDLERDALEHDGADPVPAGRDGLHHALLRPVGRVGRGEHDAVQ